MPVVELNGHRVVVSRTYGTMRDCRWCKEKFPITSITGRQWFCSESCKEKNLWQKEKLLRPDIVRSARSRCRTWAALNRGCKGRQPWLLGAPPFEPYLPGGAMTIRLNRDYELKHSWVVHGIVTALTGAHHDNIPEFTLIPTRTSRSGWGLYVRDMDRALAIANRFHECHIQGAPALAQIGPVVRFKSPRVDRRGRRRLRIDAVTPVCVRRDSGTVLYTAPTSGNLSSTLSAWLPRRIGLDLNGEDMRLELIERKTEPATVWTGKKLGTARGWIGHCVVETNAVGEWLLRVAECIGLGGKSAFGFGRIRVSDA